MVKTKANEAQLISIGTTLLLYITFHYVFNRWGTNGFIWSFIYLPIASNLAILSSIGGWVAVIPDKLPNNDLVFFKGLAIHIAETDSWESKTSTLASSEIFLKAEAIAIGFLVNKQAVASAWYSVHMDD